jgi:uncharacterized protein YjbI with pentapeptide repeats
MINETITNLDGAVLDGADLRGADISCVDGITADQLRGAIIDQTTMMPPGLEHLARDVPQINLSRRA